MIHGGDIMNAHDYEKGYVLMTEQQELEIQKLLNAESQYPEFERKSREQREADLREWLQKYDEVNACYNLYGMDRADAQPCDDWLDIKTFGKQRWDVNSQFTPMGTNLKYNHTLIARNKLIFEMFMEYWFGADSNVYIPSKGLFLRNDFFTLSGTGGQRMKPASFKDFIAGFDTGQKLVFKEVFGSMGKQIIIVEIDGGKLLLDGEALEPDEFSKRICSPAATWLIQDYFVQHPDMARFNPPSVNTLRIVTYHVGTHAFVDDVAVRMGCPGAQVDNAYSDGFYTNVDEAGRLDESLFNYSHKTRTIHQFQDAVIPSITAARDLCVQLHSLTPELFTAGWDICIAPDGHPVVIEVNDAWAVFVTQTGFGHAARPAWNRNLELRRAFDAGIVR